MTNNAPHILTFSIRSRYDANYGRRVGHSPEKAAKLQREYDLEFYASRRALARALGEGYKIIASKRGSYEWHLLLYRASENENVVGDAFVAETEY